VKGYGDVRRRMTALFDELLATAMDAATLESRRGDSFELATVLAATFRRLVLQGPDGETEARQLTTDIRAELAVADYAAACALLAKTAA